MRPLVDEIAVAVDDDDRVLEAALPTALRLLAAGRRDAVAVAGRVAAAGIERCVRRPRRGAFRQRQLAAHRDPDSIGALGVDAAERAPGPPVVRMTRVRQRLRPVLDDAVVARRPIVIAPAARRTSGSRSRRRLRRRAARREQPDRSPQATRRTRACPREPASRTESCAAYSFPLAAFCTRSRRSGKARAGRCKAAGLLAQSALAFISLRRRATSSPTHTRSALAVAAQIRRRARAIRGQRLRGADLSGRLVRAIVAGDRLVGRVARRAARDVLGRLRDGQPAREPQRKLALRTATPLRRWSSWRSACSGWSPLPRYRCSAAPMRRSRARVRSR